MKSINQRVEEFVKYHNEGDGECNNVVLKAWADRHGLNLQERYELAYYFSITYCVESALLLFKDRAGIYPNYKEWAKENKSKLIFQSDRKYMRMGSRFETCLEQFEKIYSVRDFLRGVERNGVVVLAKAIPLVSSWRLFGRFSAFLFLETFVELAGLEIDNTTIDWKHGDTATSGLMNVFGADEAADKFDKSGMLMVPEKKMDRLLAYLQEQIERAGGDPNVTKVETSLCAYRKFYKGSRYNGFYLDRMLGEINLFDKMRPDAVKIGAELREIRAQKFDEKYLGETNNYWRGIRAQLKKVYKETGQIT